MERKFYQELVNWDKKTKKKPLMVVGARQVGKTYIIEKYCKEHYKNYVYIDLLAQNNIVSLFASDISFEEKVNVLENILNISLDNKDTILFVDEVQVSEEFIESLKYFCDSPRNYNIICAGSLLGVKLKRFNRSFPVGKVRIKYMYPLDFEEFLIAIGKENYITLIRDAFSNDLPLPDVLHEEILKLFYRYVYIGGMPEVVDNYIENNQDLVSMDKDIIKDIIESYFNDMNKYNKNKKENLRIERIYRDIPSQLAKENPKFTFSKLDNKDNRKRDYVTALDWLIASQLVLASELITKPEYPINGFIDHDTYKLYLSDTGILCNMLNLASFEVITDGDYSYKGVITENYIACELQKMKFDLRYWTRHGKNKGVSELDFIIQLGTDIIPVEVKAGVKTQSKSLEIYKEIYKPKYSIRISAKNFGFENNIKSIPLYAVFCLKDLNNKLERTSEK